MRLRRSLALSLAAVAVMGTGTGLTHASAASGPTADTFHVAAIADGTWAVTGAVVGPYGKPLDNVAVEAFASGSETPVASAITYGGAYDLTVDSGVYRVTFTDLDGETAPLVLDDVAVEGDATMDRVRLLYRAPSIVVAPKIRGVIAVGKTVSATPGQWTGEDWTFTYEWLVNGRSVSTEAAYRLTSSDLSKGLAVRVSAAAVRHETGVVTTTPKTVLKAVSTLTVKEPSAKGSKVTLPVKVVAPTSLRDGRVEVREVGKKGLLGKATTSGTRAWTGKVVLSGVRSGKHTYVVTFTGTKTAGIDTARRTVTVK